MDWLATEKKESNKIKLFLSLTKTMANRNKPLPHYTTGGPHVPSVRVEGFEGPYFNAYTGKPIEKPSFGTPIMGPHGKPITPHGVIGVDGVGMTHNAHQSSKQPLGVAQPSERQDYKVAFISQGMTYHTMYLKAVIKYFLQNTS